MQDFQLRVVEERTKLCIMLDRLVEFLKTEKFKALPAEDRTLMCKQRDIMEQYSNVLAERIAKF